jgi:1-phosphofructokinase
MLRAVLIATPHVVKPNAHELAEATGRLIRTIGDVTAAAEQLRAKGLGTALVSLGRDGAVLVEGDGALHGRTAAVTAINSVGAGDAFLAGLPRSRCQRVTTRRSACLGVAVGSDGSPTPRHAVVSGR